MRLDGVDFIVIEQEKSPVIAKDIPTLHAVHDVSDTIEAATEWVENACGRVFRRKRIQQRFRSQYADLFGSVDSVISVSLGGKMLGRNDYRIEGDRIHLNFSPSSAVSIEYWAKQSDLLPPAIKIAIGIVASNLYDGLEIERATVMQLINPHKTSMVKPSIRSFRIKT